MTGIGVWVQAARPRTLSAAVVPVLLGGAIAADLGALNPTVVICALLCAVLLQIAANFANDYFDWRQGADTHERLGPVRVTQAGLASPHAVIKATAWTLVMAAGCGVYLIAQGGYPILIIGLVAMLTAIAYTMTPFKLAYRGLGEVCAFAFFGPIAVLGTLQAQLVAITPLTLGLSCPVGLWVAAIMLVNNLRDHHSDADCGKRTLVVRFGVRFGRLLYGTLITSGFAIPCALVAAGLLDAKALLVLVAIPLTIAPTQAVFAPIDGPRLNQALGQTARLTLVAGSLLALGVAL
jgi:1,4-dihydroxy-2-naphthoate octaprenyltransferase